VFLDLHRDAHTNASKTTDTIPQFLDGDFEAGLQLFSRDALPLSRASFIHIYTLEFKQVKTRALLAYHC